MIGFQIVPLNRNVIVLLGENSGQLGIRTFLEMNGCSTAKCHPASVPATPNKPKKGLFSFSCANKTFLCCPLDIFVSLICHDCRNQIKQGARSKTKSLFSQTIKERLTLEGSPRRRTIGKQCLVSCKRINSQLDKVLSPSIHGICWRWLIFQFKRTQ